MNPDKKLLLNRRVIINLLSGNAVSGVVTRIYGPLYELKDVAIHEVDATAPTAADGSTVVDKANVDFIQIP
jgi:hypothetical protein